MRLKPLHGDGYSSLLQFQFHKGAIKTGCSRPFSRSTTQFQFHKGAIKTLVGGSKSVGKSRFNSIKVRLKPIGQRDASSISRRFNSIKVRLKLHGCEVGVRVIVQFQFHKGAIKTSAHTGLSIPNTVSIP